MSEISSKKILAIGGAVIKTGRERLKSVIRSGEIEMLIHNGASLFHDFQLSIDPPQDGSHSHALKDLVKDYSVNEKTTKWVQRYIHHPLKMYVPDCSVTSLCHQMDIPVLMFTIPGADFWNCEPDSLQWYFNSEFMCKSMEKLLVRFMQDRFHYVCMGSAVIHPEIFIKCIAMAQSKYFFADVVDFLDMYRPKTRVAIYGKYYKIDHISFLDRWISTGYPDQ